MKPSKWWAGSVAAGQRAIDDAISRHFVNETVDLRFDDLHGEGVGVRVRAWANALGGPETRHSVGDWITAADLFLCSGAAIDQLESIPVNTWRTLAELHGSPSGSAHAIMATLNVLGLSLEQR